MKITALKRTELILVICLTLVISFVFSFFFNREIFFFQENRGLFIFSKDYFHKFTDRPGGLLEYAGNFISQGYHKIAIGSLLLCLFLLLSWAILLEINKRSLKARAKPFLIALLPVCLLMISQNSFNHYAHYTLGYLTVIFFFLLSILRNTRQHILLFFPLFPLLFYATGFFAFIYTCMYLIHIIVNEKGILKYYHPVILVLYVLLTFLVFKEIILLQPVSILLSYPLMISDPSGLPLFLIILSGYTILFPWFIRSGFLNKVVTTDSLFLPSTLLLIGFSVIVLMLARQKNTTPARLTRLEMSVFSQDWDALIKQQEGSLREDLLGQYYYNLALANKDQLCDRLFLAPHPFGVESLTLPRKAEYNDRAVYFYYTIGLISEAHHLAYESMVKHGYTPETLKMLIKTNLINGNLHTAERYINILKRTIHYKNFAEKYEKLLIDPLLITSDPELEMRIEMLPKTDFFIRVDDVQNIELFLISNPKNKRAFEYKMARLLFEKDIIGMIYELKNMKAMGYSGIPRHIEEAILEYSRTSKGLPDLGGLNVRPETERRFAEYYNTLNLNKDLDELQLKSRMKGEWGNTFWYYIQFQ